MINCYVFTGNMLIGNLRYMTIVLGEVEDGHGGMPESA
jgi:hypothetical protein